MSNPTVPAAAEGMPAFSRRTFLRSTAGAATLVGVGVMAATSDAATETEAATEIKRLIEAHRNAAAAFEDFLGSKTPIEEALMEDRQASPNQGKTAEEREAIERVRENAFGMTAFLEKEEEFGDAGLDALGELLDYPMTTFEEVMLKVAYFRQIRHFFDGLSSFEDPEGAFFDAFPPTSEEAGPLTALSLGSGVDNSAPDPLLAFLNEWERTETIGELREKSDAWFDEHVTPFGMRVKAGDIPDATTKEGAVAALNKILSYEDVRPMDASLIRVALAFFDGRA